MPEEPTMTPVQQISSMVLSTVVNGPTLPDDTSVVPFVLDRRDHGPGPHVPIGDYLTASFLPLQRNALLLGVAAHVMPHELVGAAHGFGVLIPLHLMTSTRPGRTPSEGPPQALADHVTLRNARWPEERPNTHTIGVIACWTHINDAKTDAAMCTEVAHPGTMTDLSSIDLAWSNRAMVPLVIARLAGLARLDGTGETGSLAAAIGAAKLLVCEWLWRLLQALRQSGSDGPQVRQVLQDSPTEEELGRFAPSSLPEAVATGRIRSNMDGQAALWAGPDLVAAHLDYEYGSPGHLLSAIAEIDAHIAAEVRDVTERLLSGR